VPYRIHAILTDNSIQFANQKRRQYAFPLLFDSICAAHRVEHCLTKPKHPCWINGQEERILYATQEKFKSHLQAYLMDTTLPDA